MNERQSRRRQLSVLALAIVGVLVWGFTSYAQSRRKPAPKKVSAAAVYTQNCARCHGADGAGTGLGKSLDAPDLTDPDVQREMSAARIRQVINNGDGAMPAFKNKLKPNEVSAVTGYVRTFKRK